MSSAVAEIANRIVRSGIEDVTASPLFPAFRLAFVRERGREPGFREAYGEPIHEVFYATDSPDTY